jgi:hypothetical protein
MPINVKLGSKAASAYLSGPASEGVAGILGSSNPYGFIAQTVLSALSAPNIKISGAAASGQTVSGQADFTGSNNVTIKKAVSLKNPLHVALIAGAVVAAVYAYKKYVR